MNIAFYIESLKEGDKLRLIKEELDRNKEYISDASIFYNSIAPLDISIPAGIFHVAEMWSFEGILVVDRIHNLLKAKNVVNNFKCWYYYDKRNQDNFINVMVNAHLADRIIANGDTMAGEYTRLTNSESNFTVNNYENISRLPI
jgi:hypothetical protein